MVEALPSDLVSKLPNTVMQAAPRALLRAARRAREIARLTNTAIVIVRDGVIVEEKVTEIEDEKTESRSDLIHAAIENAMELTDINKTGSSRKPLPLICTMRSNGTLGVAADGNQGRSTIGIGIVAAGLIAYAAWRRPAR